MRIAIASDHAGFIQKAPLADYLRSRGHEVIDLGPDNDDRVARLVAAGGADRGVLVCGTGIGMALTADKVAGIRASVIQTPEFAHLFREHNDGNVLCLSGRFTEVEVNERIIDEFLDTEFGGGRHAGRVEKIMREDDPDFAGVDA